MHVRYLVIGGTILGLTAMATGLGVVGVQNLDKERIIDQKESELNEKMYPIVPPESRVLSRPSGPSLPSPGYEN